MSGTKKVLDKMAKSHHLKSFLMECLVADVDVFVLLGHKLGGKPVLSGSMALETAKEYVAKIPANRSPSLDSYPLPKEKRN